MPEPKTQARGQDIKIFGRRLNGHHNHAFSFSEIHNYGNAVDFIIFDTFLLYDHIGPTLYKFNWNGAS